MSGYRTIVADPPWPFEWQGGTGGRRRNVTELGYVPMTVWEIVELRNGWPIATDATLFLWVTRRALHRGQAWNVAHEWGFPTNVADFIWRKPNFGTGAFPRSGHETCVVYKRGKGSLKPGAPRNVHSVQTWKQPYETNGGKTHSAKPDGLQDLIEQAHEGPYLELFARRERVGWDSWGDESGNTAKVAA